MHPLGGRSPDHIKRQHYDRQVAGENIQVGMINKGKVREKSSI